MLWDSGFESWRALKIAGQPAAVLVTADGAELGRWFGPIGDEQFEKILELATGG